MLKRFLAVIFLALAVVTVMPAVAPIVPVAAGIDQAQAFINGYDYWQLLWLYYLQETIPGWDWNHWF